MTTAAQEFTATWDVVATGVAHVGVKLDRGTLLVYMGTVIPGAATTVGLQLTNDPGEDEFVCDDLTGQTLWGRAVVGDSATATVIKW